VNEALSCPEQQIREWTGDLCLEKKPLEASSLQSKVEEAP